MISAYTLRAQFGDDYSSLFHIRSYDKYSRFFEILVLERLSDLLSFFEKLEEDGNK